MVSILTTQSYSKITVNIPLILGNVFYPINLPLKLMVRTLTATKFTTQMLSMLTSATQFVVS
jgi:hypothetical protein